MRVRKSLSNCLVIEAHANSIIVTHLALLLRICTYLSLLLIYVDNGATGDPKYRSFSCDPRQTKSSHLMTGRGLTSSDLGHDNAGRPGQDGLKPRGWMTIVDGEWPGRSAYEWVCVLENDCNAFGGVYCYVRASRRG
jgi:hypothetical protein